MYVYSTQITKKRHKQNHTTIMKKQKQTINNTGRQKKNNVGNPLVDLGLPLDRAEGERRGKGCRYR